MNPVYHNVEQRSDEWNELRKNRITSSVASGLLSTGKTKMSDEELEEFKKLNPKSRVTTKECIGDAFYTLVYETVENGLYGIAEETDIMTSDMERGIMLEPYAFDLFKDEMSLQFIDVTKIGFVTYGENEGSSPDGLVGDFGVLEIKAPKRNKFFRIVRDGLDAVDDDWQIQIQHQMRCTNRPKGWLMFIYLNSGRFFTHTIEIMRDEKIQAMFAERMDIAIKEMSDYRDFLTPKF